MADESWGDICPELISTRPYLNLKITSISDLAFYKFSITNVSLASYS